MDARKGILLLGAFDTKGEEYAYAYRRMTDLGASVVAADFGIDSSDPGFRVDVPASEVAAAGGGDLEKLRTERDRGAAMDTMAQGVAEIAKRLHAEGRLTGIFGMGGTGGSAVITTAMRALPLGVPKLCLSTVAGGDTFPYVGCKDVVLYPSVADVAGLNRITQLAIDNATAAIVGMARTPRPPVADDRPLVVASMFGNTTDCINRCRKQLTEKEFEVLVFHATGAGGRTMESLIDEGLVTASLDLTTTELADTLCGGVFDAGPDRLKAAGRQGVPQVVSPGCVDMVNFGPMSTVPAKYREANRRFYEWNPAVTLMRTTPHENAQLGRMFAERLNAATGPVAVLVPMRGFSVLGGTGQPFSDAEADREFLESLRTNLGSWIACHEVDLNINDPEFADRAVQLLLTFIPSANAAN